MKIFEFDDPPKQSAEGNGHGGSSRRAEGDRAEAGAGGESILIVEDEALIALNISAELTAAGYAVAGIASSAGAALRATRAGCPDLVLMDVTLHGERDGIEAGRLIQERYRVPILFVSAHADGPTRARAEATSPAGYLVKPFSGRQLQAAVARALAKCHRRH